MREKEKSLTDVHKDYLMLRCAPLPPFVPPGLIQFSFHQILLVFIIFTISSSLQSLSMISIMDDLPFLPI